MICELCDIDLKNFYHLKKDLSLKQKRLYDFLPINFSFKQEVNKEPTDYDEAVVIEALDDVLLGSDLHPQENSTNGNLYVPLDVPVIIQPHTTATKTKRTPRKPTIEVVAVEKCSLLKEKFQCNECGIFVSSNISLKRHVERVHYKVRNFQCDHCSYSAYFKHSLEKHIVKHIPEEFRDRFLCGLCNFVSISAANIQLHKKYEHGQTKKAYVCDIKDCNKKFSRPGP